VTGLSGERICRGREFELLGEDAQKTREAKDDLTQEGTASWLIEQGLTSHSTQFRSFRRREGTARRWQL